MQLLRGILAFEGSLLSRTLMLNDCHYKSVKFEQFANVQDFWAENFIKVHMKATTFHHHVAAPAVDQSQSNMVFKKKSPGSLACQILFQNIQWFFSD